MTEKPSRSVSTTSTGHSLSESSYLDARFLAALPEYEEMLRWVGIEKSWHILDAGSGGGVYIPLLCELAGADGVVTAFDLAPENIEACQTRLRDLKPACQVETKVGNLLQLPFGEAIFDAVWCANTTQYLSDDELATALSELKRVTRRGGLIAVKEADATCFQIANIDPAVMWRYLDVASGKFKSLAGVMRAVETPRWFRQAGLVNIRAKTTIVARFGPLKPVETVALGDLVEFTAKSAQHLDLPESDLGQWRQLLQEIMNDHLLEQPDFYIREGAIVVVGEVA